MTDESTRQRRVSGLPVKTIAVEVAAGPDRGVPAVEREDALTVGTASGNDLELRDRTVSRFHLEIRRRADRILVTDLGSTNGTQVGQALLEGSSVSVPPGTLVGVGDTELRVCDGQVVMVEMTPEDALGGLRGRSPAMKRLFAAILRVAKSNVPVLLHGESGTGKELVARAIHELGDPARPFATVDCAATVPTLFASEFFGHERGAFIGAERR